MSFVIVVGTPFNQHERIQHVSFEAVITVMIYLCQVMPERTGERTARGQSLAEQGTEEGY